jgi:lipoprotein-releasing system permease protein
MKYGWVFFVARRYFRARRKERVLTPSIFSVLGITAGVMTLITVLSVMNGFQTGFIEDILEISSYHLRIPLENVGEEEASELLNEVLEHSDVRGALIFEDEQTLIRGGYDNYEACNLRGVIAHPMKYDPALGEQLEIQEGSFILPNVESLVIGGEMARSLGVGVGDSVQIVGIGGEDFNLLNPRARNFVVEGVFRSGYYEYDRNLCFSRLEVEGFDGTLSAKAVLGVKLENRFADRRMIEELTERLNWIGPGEVESWRSYNSSFFGALRMEKMVMMMLIGLIFIVVGVNIFHGLKRTVVERSDEIALLRSLGANSFAIRRIFIVDGILIGLFGGGLGLLLGLAVSKNINFVFSVVERVGNWVLGLFYGLTAPVTGGVSRVEVFSTQYFYMQEVPSTIPFIEVFFIVGFALITSAVAAYGASKKIAEINPAEVLRNE